jgi:hypothetical protein
MGLGLNQLLCGLPTCQHSPTTLKPREVKCYLHQCLPDPRTSKPFQGWQTDQVTNIAPHGSRSVACYCHFAVSFPVFSGVSSGVTLTETILKIKCVSLNQSSLVLIPSTCARGKFGCEGIHQSHLHRWMESLCPGVVSEFTGPVSQLGSHR